MNYEVLRTFTDAFQGTYKNGTGGTRDYRYFAAGYLALRIVVYLCYALITSAESFIVAALLLIGFAVSIVITQPHKVRFHNTTDTVLILVLAMWSIAAAFYKSLDNHFLTSVYFTIILLLSIVPLVYIIGFFTYWICTQSKLLSRRFHRNTAGEVGYPDRLINPGEYEQLLQEPAAAGSNSESEERCVGIASGNSY